MDKNIIMAISVVGLLMFLYGVYMVNPYGAGLELMIAGSFLLVLAFSLYKMEAREDRLRAGRKNSNVRQSAEVSEMVLLKYQKRDSELTDDPLFREAQSYLGWGVKASDADVCDTDWWLEVPHVQCACGHNFTLVEKDRERLRFPTKPDAKIGVYLEVACEKCKRRHIVSRNF